ncbi:putative mitochondrial rna splicing protein [Heterostelium album PN500]|uniref:Magnesium transporter n=1 Tax=Heterostelium pallidum (strain ATCC 26659 / Pp 5 / PN500) TaxID=670386 RepID=D3B9L3_HETP5|nr:putative mitochondrial rna splicing protein [Heterostelium album PN500]EFA81925.1 putative mitochondrial rna splicing protein [Heterostelium album PN500]|eukprot:XP_020434042.1 putative mitochondrial rna splicing protein [Heterostelium album PN500]
MLRSSSTTKLLLSTLQQQQQQVQPRLNLPIFQILNQNLNSSCYNIKGYSSTNNNNNNNNNNNSNNNDSNTSSNITKNNNNNNNINNSNSTSSWRSSSIYVDSTTPTGSVSGGVVNNVVPGGGKSSSIVDHQQQHQQQLHQQHIRNKLFGDHRVRSTSRASPLSMSKEMKTKIFDQESFIGRDTPTQYLSETRSFKVLEVDQSGQLIDQIIFKNNLSIEMKLQARDLRTIDSSFPPQMPAILARDKVFIVSIGFIRAIVQHNKIIFFDPQNPLIRNELVPIMKEYLVSQNLFFTETLTLPFEFKVLESILVFICKKLTAEHQRICTSIAKELESLNENPEHNLETLLLYHKKGLNQFEVTLKEIMDALSRLLESDEDMALMYLSFRNITGGTRKKNQHEELEILLENYMRQLEQISNEINQLKETLSSTEEFVNFQLDTYVMLCYNILVGKR